jgi:hypothetical protein
MNADTGAVLLIILGIVVLFGAGYWGLSRVSPKGTVLIVALGLFALGHAIDPGLIRELHLVKGAITLGGFVGILLGFVDLLQRRKTPARRQRLREQPTEVTEFE